MKDRLYKRFRNAAWLTVLGVGVFIGGAWVQKQSDDTTIAGLTAQRAAASKAIAIIVTTLCGDAWALPSMPRVQRALEREGYPDLRICG